MKEYMENGCLLSWLIDPKKKETHLFRAGKKEEVISFNQELSGEEVLPGFLINLSRAC